MPLTFSSFTCVVVVFVLFVYSARGRLDGTQKKIGWQCWKLYLLLNLCFFVMFYNENNNNDNNIIRLLVSSQCYAEVHFSVSLTISLYFMISVHSSFHQRSKEFRFSRGTIGIWRYELVIPIKKFVLATAGGVLKLVRCQICAFHRFSIWLRLCPIPVTLLFPVFCVTDFEGNKHVVIYCRLGGRV